MSTTTVSKLKASLSHYLRKVKAGEEVVVTERGKAVAKLTPVDSSSFDEHIQEMIRTGALIPGKGPIPLEFWKRPRPRIKGSIVQAVIDDRNESP